MEYQKIASEKTHVEEDCPSRDRTMIKHVQMVDALARRALVMDVRGPCYPCEADPAKVRNGLHA